MNVPSSKYQLAFHTSRNSRRLAWTSNSTVRRGYTLVEMVVVISITGTLMSLAAVSLQRAFQAHQLAMDVLLHQRHVDSLRLRLKFDLAESLSVSPEGNARLVLAYTSTKSAEQPVRPLAETQPVCRVEYEFANEAVRRTAYGAGGQVLSNQSWLVGIELKKMAIEESGTVPLLSIDLQIARLQRWSSSEECRWLFRAGREEQ